MILMAADQRKRRLSSHSYGFQEQIRAKKRDLRLPNSDFNFNTHVSLKWDDNGKRIVAKDDQIGVSWRHLSQFIASTPCSNTKLADVLTIPRDLFQLNDLSEVLSYEVWQSVLTEKERNFLSQFLPFGVEVDEVVRSLSSGDNFDFGNPLSKWGSSVCSGDLHPDAVLQHEKSFKANKRDYYLELQQYHDNMIRNLQSLKQTCAGSKDPEAEIQRIVSRSKRQEKIIPFDANGQKYHKPDEIVGSVSESVSPIADEKICTSDNLELSLSRDFDIHKRMQIQDRMKDKNEKSTMASNGVKVLPKPNKKTNKVQKPILIPNDGAKYMSYVKISKKQHDLVKSMRQSGTSIQSRALNRLLGDLDSSNVKPYEMFVEEEHKKIHEYWFNLVNKDIPNAFQSWRNVQLIKRKMMDSLWKEMEDKLRDLSKDENFINQYNEEPAQPTPSHDKDKEKDESSNAISMDNQDNNLTNHDSSSDNSEEESDLHSSKSQSASENPSLNVNEVIEPSSSMESQPSQNPNLNVNEELDPSSPMETQSLPNHSLNVNKFDPSSSMENQSLQSVKEKFDTPMPLPNESLHHPSLDIGESFDPSSMKDKSLMEEDNPPLDDEDEAFTSMDLNAENNSVTCETSNPSSLPEQHISNSGVLTSITDPNPPELPGSSSSIKNIWPSIGLHESYDSHPTTSRSGSGGLSIRHQQVTTPAQLIDLEPDVPEEDATKDLLNRHTSHLPFYNTYSNRDRSELLHSVIKRDNVLLDPTNQFPTHFRDHLQHPQFVPQNIQGSMYSVQPQEHFPSLDVRDWSNTRLPNPTIHTSQLNSGGELLNHNWFPTNDNRSHSGWSPLDSSVFPAPSLGSGSSGSDQSLYSVLTQCNMRPQVGYTPVGSTERMITPSNYGHDMVGGINMTANGLAPPVSPFDYLSGGEASSNTLKNPDLGSMSLGHPPSGLQNPSGKPFLKSWNQ